MKLYVPLAITLVMFPLSTATAADGEAKGTLSYKGTTVTLQYAYLVKGPDSFDPKKTIRKLILSKTDIGAKIKACKTMSAAEGEVMEGITVDFDAGPRLNYWLALNGQRLQYSGTAVPSAMKQQKGDDAKRLAGTLSIDDSASGGPRLEVEFAAALLKEFMAAR